MKMPLLVLGSWTRVCNLVLIIKKMESAPSVSSASFEFVRVNHSFRSGCLKSKLCIFHLQQQVNLLTEEIKKLLGNYGP